jgi:hypothetical protein
MSMLALDITIIIVDTLFRPHLTIMSSIIYMYKSVHKKNPIKIGEGGKLIWVMSLRPYEVVHVIFDLEVYRCYILIFPLYSLPHTGTLRCESNMLTVDENTVLFNNGQNVLIQSKRFVQNP